MAERSAQSLSVAVPPPAFGGGKGGLLRRGKLDLAEKYGTEYIAIDPLEESAFSTLMQVYRDQKKFRKALGLYHTLCKNLSDEFSISPLKETSALYYQIVDAWNTSTYKLEVGSDQQLIGQGRGAAQARIAVQRLAP